MITEQRSTKPSAGRGPSDGCSLNGQESQVAERGGVSLLLDAGAFLAVERGDRDIVALRERDASPSGRL